jgi:pilus assembly protein CpaB
VSSRKLFILVGAILVGCFAGFAVMRYVQSVEDAAYEGVERVEVFVAAGDIPAGAGGASAASAFEVRMVPRDVRPATAVTSLDAITGKVAVNAIPANSILVQGMFTDPSVAVSSFSQTLNDGMVAVSFNFAEAQGVARWLRPGDRVNIMVRSQVEAADATAEGGAVPAAQIFKQPARMLYQDVLILSIGQSTMAAPGQRPDEEDVAAFSNGLITFALPQEAALRLASVDEASLYLTLVPPSYTPAIVAPFGAAEFDPSSPLPGEDPARLTPYGPAGYAGLIDEIAGSPTDSAFTD